ncbi:MAG: hypothetical protein H6720_07125, partial [Sandaracinus sp.]|nr:hypothetical protein [Sandaracinus sp.]
ESPKPFDESPKPFDERPLLALATDDRAAPSARLDAVAALGRADASESAVAALARLLRRCPIEPSHDRFGPRIATSLAAMATRSSEAGLALLSHARRLDYASLAASSPLPALVRNSAPLTNEEDALFEHVTTALRARPADGAASGRFDLVLADAARLLSALAEAPARRARAALLAPDAAHWLVHDPTPALGFDTVTPAVLDALVALDARDAQTAQVLERVVRGETSQRRLVPSAQADALAVAIRLGAVDASTALDRLDALCARSDAKKVVGWRLLTELPRLPEPAAELAAERVATLGAEAVGVVCRAYAKAHDEGRPVDASTMLPHAVAFATSKKIAERIDAVAMLANLAGAGVPEARDALATLAEDRSAKVRDRVAGVHRTRD